MTKYAKFLKRFLSGHSDTDIAFDDLCSLLKRLGFQERVHGDHHIFNKESIVEIINLQPDNAKAKPYQVKQIRILLRKYRLDKERR
ncbi:MAG TPA: type II toxin-antitoxin system HicA family toxin [Anaerolineales bacterium]